MSKSDSDYCILPSIFNCTRVTREEFNEYVKEGFINEKFETERKVYNIIFVIFNIFAFISFGYFLKLRNSYIVRQRNFNLTFTAGIFTYINIILGFIPQFITTPCILSVFTADILNPVINFLFLSRSLRVILFYHFNIFKVNTITKRNETNTRKIQGQRYRSIEPNSFYPKITRRINLIIALFIIIPTLIAIVAVLTIYISKEMYRDDKCPIFKAQDPLINLKQGKLKDLFIVIKSFSFIYMLLNFISAVMLIYVKDTNKYGLKFECLSVSILILIIHTIDIFLQKKCSMQRFYTQLNKLHELPLRGYMDIFERTKGGKMLFTIVSVYLFFISITLPVIHYYHAKRIRNGYFDDPLSSIQFFYKVLNTPSLVSELRDIAIKEFSVENVLFWENFQLLQKMVTRYQIEFKKAKEMGDERIVTQYDFEDYYQQQLYHSYSTGTPSIDESSYDPSMPVPKELLPYYTSFYYMFIDFNGPAVVNLLGETVKHIFNEICTYPTVGMYDNAKNEVVEMMFSSIYPILLDKSKKHLTETLG